MTFKLLPEKQTIVTYRCQKCGKDVEYVCVLPAHLQEYGCILPYTKPYCGGRLVEVARREESRHKGETGGAP